MKKEEFILQCYIAILANLNSNQQSEREERMALVRNIAHDLDNQGMFRSDSVDR